ncbi:MAG: hypothetical protein WCH39_16675 [Schlesneria sp.]
MASVIFLMLPLSVLFVFGLMALAFADVAFREVRVASGSYGGGSGPVRNQSPLADIYSSLSRMTDDVADLSNHASSACESFVPAVTNIEANAIAEELRHRRDGELHRVMERSRNHGCSCPMLTQTGMCACSIARPLACIGRCTLGGDSPEWVQGLGSSVSEAFRHHLESRQVNAEIHRLDDALVSLIDHAGKRLA